MYTTACIDYVCVLVFSSQVHTQGMHAGQLHLTSIDNGLQHDAGSGRWIRMGTFALLMCLNQMHGW